MKDQCKALINREYCAMATYFTLQHPHCNDTGVTVSLDMCILIISLFFFSFDWPNMLGGNVSTINLYCNLLHYKWHWHLHCTVFYSKELWGNSCTVAWWPCYCGLFDPFAFLVCWSWGGGAVGGFKYWLSFAFLSCLDLCSMQSFSVDPYIWLYILRS